MSITISTTSNAITVSDQVPLTGATVSGTVSSQLNYCFNNSVNSIEGAGSDANVWSNTISGGGNATYPNLIYGSTSLRTISGGYDHIIGRSASSNPGDLTATIASQIIAGAHHRIFINGDLSQAVQVPVNTGVTHPNHATIVGGSYHQIRNGDYAIIAGGTNSTIQEKPGFDDVSNGSNAFVGAGYKHLLNGNYSGIVSGNQNIVECYNSFIGSGGSNSITMPKDSGGTAKGNCVIAGGQSNVINCSGQAAIVGGANNTISSGSGNTDKGLYAFIGGGYGNQVATTLYSAFSVICGGYSNIVNNQYSSVVGGRENDIQSLYCVGIGYNAKATNYGAFVQGGKKFSATGDAQSSVYVVKRQTQTAVATSLVSMDQPLSIPSDTAWAFKCLVVARATASNTNAAFDVSGLVVNNSGSAALIGIPTITTIANDAGASSWAVTVTVSGTNLNINAVGADSTTINWVGRLELAEVTA